MYNYMQFTWEKLFVFFKFVMQQPQTSILSWNSSYSLTCVHRTIKIVCGWVRLLIDGGDMFPQKDILKGNLRQHIKKLLGESLWWKTLNGGRVCIMICHSCASSPAKSQKPPFVRNGQTKVEVRVQMLIRKLVQRLWLLINHSYKIG